MDNNNLLIRLHKYASYQDENFTTEAFVHLLEYLQHHEFSSLEMLVRKLTGEKINLESHDPEEISIITQVSTEEGRPDIEISGPDFIVYIEVKVDSGLGDHQLERYRRVLSTSQKEKQLLILLSRYHYDANDDVLDNNLRWWQIGNWLQNETIHDDVSDTSRYLIEQFTEYMQYRDLMFFPARSSFSEGLNEYLKKDNGGNILRAVRSLNALDDHEELIPLRQILDVMGTALRNIFPNANLKLWSGTTSRKGGGWVGHNINNMEFFFCIYVREADILVFETFKHEIDPDKYANQPGQIFESYDSKKWDNGLDISSPELDFFSKSSHEQLSILEKFLEECIEAVKQLSNETL